MAFRITLQPSGHAFEAKAGDSLLQAALDAGFTLPYGCRNGACGSCKGKVLSGQVDDSDAEPHALTDEDRQAGLTLFCCAYPRSDLELEVREVAATRDIPVKVLPCRVQQMDLVAPDVMVLKLKLPANERLQFLAGQYVEFLLKDGQRRAFSIANAPHDDDMIELHVRHVPGGVFTEHVFHAMKAREILRFEGPLGTFFLRENSPKPIIFIAGGTGFAPMKSVIEHAMHSRLDRPMSFYWGARDRAGLYLPELPEKWAATYPRFRYVPVLSEPQAEDQWTGRTGLVHQAVLEDHPDLSGVQVYACGAPAMIEAVKADLVARGLPAEEFYADAFSFAPPAAPKT